MRTEEVLIVGLVLVLWVGAIALFFNRWGKIRMLEPYQPKFQQQHRSSCPLVDIESLSPINHPRSSFSRMSMGCSLQIPPGHFGSMSGPSRSSLCNVKGMFGSIYGIYKKWQLVHLCFSIATEKPDATKFGICWTSVRSTTDVQKNKISYGSDINGSGWSAGACVKRNFNLILTVIKQFCCISSLICIGTLFC